MRIMVERQIIQQKNLTFILSEKIVVSTGYQSFILEPISHRWNVKLSIVRQQIESGDIKTVVDLASACGNKIKWVITYHD